MSGRTDYEILTEAAIVLTRDYRQSGATEKLLNAMIRTADASPQNQEMRTLGETCLSIYCREKGFRPLTSSEREVANGEARGR
jgi:hypothetical protein